MNSQADVLKLVLNGPEQMTAFAGCFARMLQANDVVALDGDLGAGKTFFSREIGFALGATQPLTSPTFSLLDIHQLASSSSFSAIQAIYHFDVYRLNSSEDFVSAGFEDYLFSDGICLIEWARVIQDCLPERTIWVEIEKQPSSADVTCDPEGRIVLAEDTSPRQITIRASQAVIERLKAVLMADSTAWAFNLEVANEGACH